MGSEPVNLEALDPWLHGVSSRVSTRKLSELKQTGHGALGFV